MIGRPVRARYLATVAASDSFPAAAEKVSRWTSQHHVASQISFRIGGQESAGGMADAREAALAFVAGREVQEIVRLGEEIYDELMADRIWGPTRAIAQQHLDAGQRVWLVTA